MLGAMSLVLAIWSHLARHQLVIELLHRLGADDGDIAARFQTQALLLGLLGGAGAAVAGALTVIWPGYSGLLPSPTGASGPSWSGLRWSPG